MEPVPQRAKDWLLQADRDLKQARLSAAEGLHEWSCFAAQRAAEKAAKAIHLMHGQEMVGPAVTRLLKAAAVPVSEQLLEKARVLDLYLYDIPARYPNAHSEGVPFEFFGAGQSEEAVRYASEIVQFARSEVAKG